MWLPLTFLWHVRVRDPQNDVQNQSPSVINNGVRIKKQLQKGNKKIDNKEALHVAFVNSRPYK